MSKALLNNAGYDGAITHGMQPMAEHKDDLRYCLLVEDDPLHAEICGAMLRHPTASAGMHVVNARTCEEAMDLAMRRASWHVILLDLRLPDGDGSSLVEPLLERFPGTPIIVLTAVENEDTAAALIEEGVQECLLKGHFNQTTLLRAIRFAHAREQRRCA